MSEPIISVSGLRGIVGESLDPTLAIRYVTAFAADLPEGAIVVSRDGRETGEMLADAINSGLNAVGRDVIYADVAATPTTGVLVRNLNAVGGIQISASHNPPPYNGIKLFSDEGRVITADAGQKVIDRYRADKTQWVDHSRIGSVAQLDDTTSAHLQLVLETVDVDLIRSANFKVILDSNHGAGSVLGRKLLNELNTDFQILGDHPDGQFEHPPEPTAVNLATVVEQANEFGANVVFCQDPDADRLAIIDEKGKYIGEEFTVAITLQNRLRQKTGAVVVNCATSRMSEDLAASFDCPFHRSAVGEANVTTMMIETDAVYGGEGNGGPIDPKVGFVRDSFVGMAQTLEAMAFNKKTISQLAADIPQYSIHKTTAQVDPQRLLSLMDEIQDKFSGVECSRLDGLRLSWDDRWLLVRASNTEPIIRIIAEAKTEQIASDLCEQVKSVI